MTTPADVLQFWFGESDEPRKAWFEKNADFDAEIASRFGTSVHSAMNGELASWAQSVDGRLATLLLLDQFTRNMFRGTPGAFDGDPRALLLACGMVADGDDGRLPPLRRSFVYLPLMHAEDLAIQDRSVALHQALAADAPTAASASSLDYAERHRDVIRRFGRFPHRNPILGRDSTAEEVEFLKQPGSGF